MLPIIKNLQFIEMHPYTKQQYFTIECKCAPRLLRAGREKTQG
uniref:Uncharacterized protein n=1 Tax=Anguilla anguilla TaxID=7936 RepID=A0A0E9R3E1_ANGAN